ncbi:MAG: hypothetical protein KAJ95_05410 [Gammaproteobacteria bacterium]|nr:hypothetical protein [Gammaproteobacteria bacterium]
MSTNTAKTSEHYQTDTSRYAKCIEVSKRVRWEIDEDVIRGRKFDFDHKFLPDGLSLLNDIEFLTEDDKRLLSQIQGRTYANIFGLVERFINTKILEVSNDHALGDQTALEAMIRFSDEEIKHQELFRRIERLAGADMPEGYTFAPDANEVAKAVLSKSTWAVLALTCHIELFTQAHYKQSIEPGENLSELFKDVFLFHWREESQHAIIDELEWRREDKTLNDAERDQAVDDFIDLVVAVDGILQAQSEADASYFCMIANRSFSSEEKNSVMQGLLRAYRWQYILSGAEEPRFTSVLGDLISEQQGKRIGEALSTLV